MSQIVCKNLAIGYEGNVILKDINFSVEKKDYLCILGENGAGKSTLMNTMLGLIPPISGDITFENKNEIGYLPQQTSRQKDFPASVYEIVLSGALASCGLRPFYNKEEKLRANKAIEQLGLTELKNRCYRELSGGQQERVLLARAITTSRKILLLDEPSAGLDPEITKEVYALIDDFNKNEDVTIIMISHDLSETFKYANKILRLGKEMFFGSKDDYVEKINFKE